MSTKWAIDGYVLTQGDARNIETRAGWSAVGSGNGENATVPNRPGVVWQPKTLGPGSFSLDLWVAAGNEAALLREWENLLRVATPLNRLVHVVRTMPDGEVRECYAEHIGQISPVQVGVQGMRANIAFSIPSGVWTSQQQYVHDSDASAGGAWTANLLQLAPSTGPMSNLVLEVHGPTINPTITDITDGSTRDAVTYAGNVGAGQVLALHSGTWQVSATGFTPNLAAVTPTGPRIMTVHPALPGSFPQLRLTAAGGNANTRLRVVGPRSYR